MTPEERRKILLAPISLPVTHGSCGKSYAGVTREKVVFDGDRGFIQRTGAFPKRLQEYEGLKSNEEIE
jgi:hypothetical protein